MALLCVLNLRTMVDDPTRIVTTLSWRPVSPVTSFNQSVIFEIQLVFHLYESTVSSSHENVRPEDELYGFF